MFFWIFNIFYQKLKIYYVIRNTISLCWKMDQQLQEVVAQIQHISLRIDEIITEKTYSINDIPTERMAHAYAMMSERFKLYTRYQALKRLLNNPRVFEFAC